MITKTPRLRVFNFTIDARFGDPDGCELLSQTAGFTPLRILLTVLRPFFVVNGQLDGPLIEANQGARELRSAARVC